MNIKKTILKSFFLLLLFQLFFLPSQGQVATETTTIIDPIEALPTFKGSTQGVHCFIDATIDKKKVLRRKVTGFGAASFLVNTSGKVTDVRLVKSLDAVIDQEFLRVLHLMPNWTPAKQGEKVVPVRMTVSLRVPFLDYACPD